MHWVLPLLLSLLPPSSGSVSCFQTSVCVESTEESWSCCFSAVLPSGSAEQVSLGMCGPDGLDAASRRPDIDLEAPQCSFLTSFLSTSQHGHLACSQPAAPHPTFLNGLRACALFLPLQKEMHLLSPWGSAQEVGFLRGCLPLNSVMW